MKREILFNVDSVLNVKIALSKERWDLIRLVKHPSMDNRKEDMKETLMNAEEVRKSKEDPKVFLYYRKENNYFICVVAKHLNKEGFVITSYITDKIKEGELVWKR